MSADSDDEEDASSTASSTHPNPYWGPCSQDPYDLWKKRRGGGEPAKA